MSWHYKARKVVHEISHGGSYHTETQYELVEVMEPFEGPETWTEDAISPAHETKEGLVAMLRKAADDVEKYDVIDTAKAEKDRKKLEQSTDRFCRPV
jgi:hypothetical protein